MALSNMTRIWPSASTRAVIASFKAARGLDLRDVNHVFILGVPATPDDYLHLAGRAGREGRKGTVNQRAERERMGERERGRLLPLSPPHAANAVR